MTVAAEKTALDWNHSEVRGLEVFICFFECMQVKHLHKSMNELTGLFFCLGLWMWPWLTLWFVRCETFNSIHFGHQALKPSVSGPVQPITKDLPTHSQLVKYRSSVDGPALQSTTLWVPLWRQFGMRSSLCLFKVYLVFRFTRRRKQLFFVSCLLLNWC